MKTNTAIKSTLTGMNVGASTPFPLSKRGSIRTTASNLKLDGYLFTTEMQVENKIIVVTRKK